MLGAYGPAPNNFYESSINYMYKHTCNNSPHGYVSIPTLK
jgi:hypothetical protein